MTEKDRALEGGGTEAGQAVSTVRVDLNLNMSLRLHVNGVNAPIKIQELRN